MQQVESILRRIVIYGGLVVLGSTAVLVIDALFDMSRIGWIVLTVTVAFAVFVACLIYSFLVQAEADIERMKEMFLDE